MASIKLEDLDPVNFESPERQAGILCELSGSLSNRINGGSGIVDYKLENTKAVLYDRSLYLYYLKKGLAYHLP
ncbi:hypothetical protein IFO70_30430 [Phormidium tenue FACHB-886]|nr:hypothetical protein [Phormidium tenue FACHB-886]